MKIIDTDHPFYKPLWRRILITLAPLLWAVFEMSNGAYIWAAVFAAIGLYAGYHLLVTYERVQ